MTDELDRIHERLLLLRCQAGDPHAFADLVARYHHQLAGYLANLLGEPSADALQDVWLAAWRGLPRLADPAAFPAWVFRIARDRAFAELRRRHRAAPAVPADESLPAADDDAFTPADAARVRAAVGRLAPPHRDVLVLRFLEGLSYEQVASVLGCPVGTVRSRLHHAKLALRPILEREGM